MPADERVTQILSAAHESVTAANIPADLRTIAFEKAVEILSGQAKQSAPISSKADEIPKVQKVEGAAAAKTLEKIAEKLNVTLETVEYVYDTSSDVIKLNIPTGKLPNGKSAGAQMITLLLVAGRHAGGWDTDWTPISEVKTACEQYGRFDTDHFAKHLKALDNDFSFNGSRATLKVKPRRSGLEKATAELKRLGGEIPEPDK